ncbi:MAG: magnesium/cobalt transporter CorA [Synechococcaceae cyanobacterium SM2_3_2]|nr:magnesium/cobalt transporter CorA [Synechococcaceae cyanobacterium SM2_3_2]
MSTAHWKPQPLAIVPDDEDDSYVDYYYDDPGDMPGTLDINPDAPQPRITLLDYNHQQALERPILSVQECTPFLASPSTTWIDLQGLGSEHILQQVGQVFGLHPLALEDVVNVPQRPKVEEYDQQLILICRRGSLKGEELTFSQISLIMGRQYLLTMQEDPALDPFQPIRDRIKTQKGVISQQSTDYLVYALLDTIIDSFFPVLEEFGERIEELEDEVILNPTPQTLDKVHQLKRDLLSLRRVIWPHRDLTNALIRNGNILISPEVRIYLRDCYDHIIQLLDMVETYRELASSLMEVYLSAVSNRMNEIMQVLTVISAIFIPLTFVAGVYGMNFNPDRSPLNMPELNWYWGYPLSLLLMVLIAGAEVYIFWKKGWFRKP